MAQMRKSAAKPAKLGTKVKVSSNVTVLAPRNKRISSAEEARLKNINKLAKSSKGDAKKSAKALKESGKTSKKAKVTTYTDRSVTPVRKGVQAREMAQKLSEKRTAERKRAGIPGGGGLRGGFGMGGGGGSGRSNVNR